MNEFERIEKRFYDSQKLNQQTDEMLEFFQCLAGQEVNGKIKGYAQTNLETLHLPNRYILNGISACVSGYNASSLLFPYAAFPWLKYADLMLTVESKIYFRYPLMELLLTPYRWQRDHRILLSSNFGVGVHSTPAPVEIFPCITLVVFLHGEEFRPMQ